MFKQRRQRVQQNAQNPVINMEEFYLNQYFRSQPSPHTSQPLYPTHANPTNDRFPPIEFARLHQLELRVARIEQYLGLTAPESSTNPTI